MKLLETNLTKEVKDVCTNNDKTLIKETEKIQIKENVCHVHGLEELKL